MQYRIDSQKLGSTDTKIFAINEENQLILKERPDYSQPGNDADGTLFDHNKATVVIEVSDGSALTEFRTFEFNITNSIDDDAPKSSAWSLHGARQRRRRRGRRRLVARGREAKP